MTKNNQNQSKKADYGQDMPGIIISSLLIGTIFIILAGLLYHRYVDGNSHQNLLMAIVFTTLAVLLFTISIAGIWTSRYGKLILRDKVFNILTFNGSESTLDIGCGKGLLLIETAKRTPNGKATGADLWAKTVEYNYIAEMALENAKTEGVSDRVEVVTADVQAMPFGNNSFDMVMTSLMMHHVPDINKALNEMIRVTKPGGIILIADVNSKRFVPMFKSLGLLKVESQYATRLFFMPAHVITGIKPE
jgi:arsenite methyltransferase